jgi:hypothetical protein
MASVAVAVELILILVVGFQVKKVVLVVVAQVVQHQPTLERLE